VRILVATHNYPRFQDDPAGAFVRRLAEATVAAGHQVRVVAPHAPGLPARVMENGVEVVRFRYAPDSLERVAYRGDLHRTAPVSALALLGVPVFLVANHVALNRERDSFRPDILHAHWWLPSGWLASRLHEPFIVTLHGSDARLLERWDILRRIARRVFDRAASVTTVSEFLAADLKKILPGLSRPVVTARMPLDVDHFARGRACRRLDPPQILYAGNLLASKGIDVLLAAYSLLLERGIACTLKILGEGPHEEQLHATAAGLRLDGKVRWSHFVGQNLMPNEYGASTVVVLPTRGQAEGLGLVLAEALLAGCAVVGTPAGGIPEVVQDGVTGLIARDGDPIDLADRIEQLLRDEALRERTIEAGNTHVRAQFSPQHAVEKFLMLYDAARPH
jgi:glycosyltransferase involved in cell wall biosynthesis